MHLLCFAVYLLCLWMVGLGTVCDLHSWLICTVHLDNFEECDAALEYPLTSESRLNCA